DGEEWVGKINAPPPSFGAFVDRRRGLQRIAGPAAASTTHYGYTFAGDAHAHASRHRHPHDDTGCEAYHRGVKRHTSPGRSYHPPVAYCPYCYGDITATRPHCRVSGRRG